MQQTTYGLIHDGGGENDDDGDGGYSSETVCGVSWTECNIALNLFYRKRRQRDFLYMYGLSSVSKFPEIK